MSQWIHNALGLPKKEYPPQWILTFFNNKGKVVSRREGFGPIPKIKQPKTAVRMLIDVAL